MQNIIKDGRYSLKPERVHKISFIKLKNINMKTDRYTDRFIKLYYFL